MLFRRQPVTTIDVQEAHRRQRRGDLVLVDVREAGERAAGAPAGSLHLPLTELPGRLSELPPGTIGFVCRSGRRSVAAAVVAERAGRDACSVGGGMTAWTSAGLPEGGPSRRR
ncbi:MAG: rhodanese-like domain-containing protein [Solirubrobacteraceae bacterium]|nr:rhodanese-like domain-containing protein [Solirubrobacteraceae bacterium]